MLEFGFAVCLDLYLVGRMARVQLPLILFNQEKKTDKMVKTVEPFCSTLKYVIFHQEFKDLKISFWKLSDSRLLGDNYNRDNTHQDLTRRSTLFTILIQILASN